MLTSVFPSHCPRSLRQTLLRILLLACVTALLAWSVFAPMARAAEINVTGACTLVDAINAANTDVAKGGCTAGNGADVLVLDSNATYSLSAIDNSFGGDGSNGLPPITSPVIIDGNGATIARDLSFGCPSGVDQGFRIFYVDATGNLTLRDVTVRNGCASNSPGGGVYNDGGMLAVQDSHLLSNFGSQGRRRLQRWRKCSDDHP